MTNFSEDELKSNYIYSLSFWPWFYYIFGRTSTLRSWTTDVRNHALSPTVQLLVELRFFTSGSFFEVIGDTVRTAKVHHFPDNSRRFCSINPKAEQVYPLRNYRRWNSMSKGRVSPQRRIPRGDRMCRRNPYQTPTAQPKWSGLRQSQRIPLNQRASYLWQKRWEVGDIFLLLSGGEYV